MLLNSASIFMILIPLASVFLEKITSTPKAIDIPRIPLCDQDLVQMVFNEKSDTNVLEWFTCHYRSQLQCMFLHQ